MEQCNLYQTLSSFHSCSIAVNRILYLVVRVLPHPLQRNPLPERVSSFSKSKGGKKGGTFLEVHRLEYY